MINLTMIFYTPATYRKNLPSKGMQLQKTDEVTT